MIKLKNINHFYDDKEILRDLSLCIEANKITCLLGESGSGKTTILRLIAGLELPRKGEIYISDKLVTKNNYCNILPNKRKIGFIFQDLALWPHFTIYKNIAFGLEEQKEKNIKEKVYEILDFFNLKNQINKYPNQLSGGQKQLVAISRALVLSPQILLMDEPLSSLDVKLKKKILQYIKTIKERFNLTIIYVTHNHKEAFEIADTIVVLNKGELVKKGSVEEIKKSENEFLKYFLEY